jgi:hypothetical protein
VWISFVIRDNQLVPVGGATTLRAGDEILALTDPGAGSRSHADLVQARHRPRISLTTVLVVVAPVFVVSPCRRGLKQLLSSHQPRGRRGRCAPQKAPQTPERR